MELEASDLAMASPPDLHLAPLDLPPAFPSPALKVGRHPRWSRHESLALVQAKHVEEAKWSKVKEERQRGIEIARANSDSKWLSISHFCERLGVVRSAAQCRKRWCNLSADYKRIRDWQSLRGRQSFWLMGNELRKHNKLPGCFDREVFESMDKSIGKNACIVPEMIFDSGRQVVDDGLFSDIEHPMAEEDQQISPDKEVQSSPIESFAPMQGAYEENFDKFRMYACEDVCEEKPSLLPDNNKKKKRPVVEENDDFRDELFACLERNGNILRAHMDSQNLNSHLDRTQRKEHAESLVHVLGKLADALGKIADRL